MEREGVRLGALLSTIARFFILSLGSSGPDYNNAHKISSLKLYKAMRQTPF